VEERHRRAKASERAKQEAARKKARRRKGQSALAWEETDSSSSDDASDSEAEGTEGHAWQPSRTDIGKVAYMQGVCAPCDPTDDIAKTLLMWTDMYCDARRARALASELEELFRSVEKVQAQAIKVLPWKSGSNSGWNTTKFHDLSHIIDTILCMGNLECCSAQAPEHCHQFFVKIIASLTNKHPDWAKTAMGRLAIKQLLHEIQVQVLKYQREPPPPPSPGPPLVPVLRMCVLRRLQKLVGEKPRL
jgi:hypothetical protein